MRRTFSVVLVSALFLFMMAETAFAVLPPMAYQMARKMAKIRVSVKVSRVIVPKTATGQCGVTGRVASIQRNKTKLSIKKGMKISFKIHCRKKGAAIPMGPVLWQDVDALKKAEFVDAYLNPLSLSVFKVPLYQLSIVSKPLPDAKSIKKAKPVKKAKPTKKTK